ncbi:putative permease [Leptolyngbya sp. PCC 7375]|nr:putative permease [Leptolyngbya sp. PCC 7375]
MNHVAQLGGTVLIGILTGTADVLAGVGGLLSVPFMIFIGLPPHMAIATDRLGTLGGRVASLITFTRSQSIVWSLVPWLCILSIGGSFVGANLLLSIDEQIINRVIGILLIALLPIILMKNLGVTRKTVTPKWRYGGMCAYFFVMIYRAIFGMGTGPLTFTVMMGCFGTTLIESIATSQIPTLIGGTISVIIFALNGIVNLQFGLALVSGMILGSYVASRFAVINGNTWVKRLFVVFVTLAAFRLLTQS